ncbi:hypothetical protein KIK06_01760 [Nocardiopsis sp. EMB25]|uniref:hypothetical protein n=1 Tax=Nocardiopsis TaxID=2013 RepID=UPI0003658C1D|nr:MULTISPECIES: hypothetical protein [Nocardiopsis]MCY9782614.1 hypothetical protein [Nocardiopsis sp. EMB25]
MTSVNSLVNIAVFGIGGAVITAALIGLLLVVAGSGNATSPKVRTGFGVVSVVLLVLLPTFAAASALSGGAGFWAAFATAACVAAVVCAVNIALLPLAARRQAAASGAGSLAALRPSLPVVAVALVICVALGLLGAGVAALTV